MKRILFFIFATIAVGALTASGTEGQTETPQRSKATNVPPVVRSQIGDSSVGTPSGVRMVNVGKKQQFNAAQKASFDRDINSPKSVHFSKDGRKFYVNSLEGCKTVVYDAVTLEKLGVIEHKFTSGTGDLWASPSGYYPFTHYKDGASRAFSGKPVESALSHDGRYLWVPYYRRTFDLNAQDPSAIAVIDTRTDKIIRMFETGPLPKMVATSPDNSLLAITHWGNNTVGFIDISSDDPKDWHHLAPVTVGTKLNLNYSLTTPVDRDSGSGYLLRGTVFTPDSKYLLVSGMAGPLAVIEPRTGKHIGMVGKVVSVRHLAIKDGWVYGSQNSAGQAIRFSLDSLINGVKRAEASGSKSISLNGEIKSVKVGGGARTLDVSPDGKFLFVACNSGNAIYMVDASEMKVVDHLRCDSYPVGLALSNDGRRMIVTSQGRKGHGGNAVNIFDIRRPDLPDVSKAEIEVERADSISDSGANAAPAGSDSNTPPTDSYIPYIPIMSGLAALLFFVFGFLKIKRSKRNGA